MALLVLSTATAVGALVLLLSRPQAAGGGVELRLAAPASVEQFARADRVVPITLPEDLGAHPAFQTEWWYFTGNLKDGEGQQFGYQLTFFRRGLTPRPTARSSELATNQIFFAHLALTDVESDTHSEFERFSRGVAGLAGVESPPFRAWLEDWQVESLDVEGSRLRLVAAAEDVQLELDLESRKPLVLHGEAGLSPKSEDPGNASYYSSFTNMDTTGSIWIAGEERRVNGKSWFDHEWSTSALGPGAVGWDWFSLQADSGEELMYFQIRQEDGTVEPVSSGSLIDANGKVTRISSSEIVLTARRQWTSPESGATYPVEWTMSVPEQGLELQLAPLVADQEMNLSFTYWEGAVRFEGTWKGAPVQGMGFLEMTGYAESMQGAF